MSWVKLDDGFSDHRKMLEVAERCGKSFKGAAACWLWACGLAYANRQAARDGFVPEIKVASLYPVKGSSELAGLLVDVGLWERVEGGYMIHDYHDYQPAKSLELKARRSVAGAAGGRASGASRRAKSEANAKQLASDDAKQNLKQSEAPTRPDPTRPTAKTSPADAGAVAASAPLALEAAAPPTARDKSPPLPFSPLAASEAVASTAGGKYTHCKPDKGPAIAIGRLIRDFPTLDAFRALGRHLAAGGDAWPAEKGPGWLASGKGREAMTRANAGAAPKPPPVPAAPKPLGVLSDGTVIDVSKPRDTSHALSREEREALKVQVLGVEGAVDFNRRIGGSLT